MFKMLLVLSDFAEFCRIPDRRTSILQGSLTDVPRHFTVSRQISIRLHLIRLRLQPWLRFGMPWLVDQNEDLAALLSFSAGLEQALRGSRRAAAGRAELLAKRDHISIMASTVRRRPSGVHRPASTVRCRPSGVRCNLGCNYAVISRRGLNCILAKSRKSCFNIWQKIKYMNISILAKFGK